MCSEADPWLLPEGVEEVLPPYAREIECLRREVLDLFETWGYRFVITPFVEYLESLLTGTGSDLDLETFKLIDQLSGRSMGVRADMTPQVARIHAHHMRGEGAERLCYLGTVLHARPGGPNRSRSPIQVGAELFGHPELEGDAEVVCLMIETLRSARDGELHVDLGHVGIFRGLARQAKLNARAESACHRALQRKAPRELAALVEQHSACARAAQMILALPELNGDGAVLERARAALAGADAAVTSALDTLERLARVVRAREPQVHLHFDLAELRGYHYHTGVVFAAFARGFGEEIARGGRYDAIGEVFGHPDPATGFSTDLHALMRLRGHDTGVRERAAIVAPFGVQPELERLVKRLRAEGERVIYELPGSSGANDARCARYIAERDGQWRVFDR